MKDKENSKEDGGFAEKMIVFVRNKLAVMQLLDIVENWLG